MGLALYGLFVFGGLYVTVRESARAREGTRLTVRACALLVSFVFAYSCFLHSGLSRLGVAVFLRPAGVKG